MDVSKMTNCDRIASVAKSGHVFARMVDTLHTRAGNKSLSGEDLSTLIMVWSAAKDESEEPPELSQGVPMALAFSDLSAPTVTGKRLAPEKGFLGKQIPRVFDIQQTPLLQWS